MFLAYVLLVVLPIAGVAYILWSHRKKTAQREAEAVGRMEEILGVAPTITPRSRTPRSGEERPGRDTASATQATARVTPASAAAAPAAQTKPPNPFAGRERLLTPSQTLLYYLLRTALPGHVVFAQTSVASILDPSPTLAAYAREEQARIFARHIVDFVVTDKSTRPVAAVQLTGTGENQIAALTAMREWFASSGVRYVEIDAAALPRKEAVRALVLGDALPEDEEQDVVGPP